MNKQNTIDAQIYPLDIHSNVILKIHNFFQNIDNNCRIVNFKNLMEIRNFYNCKIIKSVGFPSDISLNLRSLVDILYCNGFLPEDYWTSIKQSKNVNCYKKINFCGKTDEENYKDVSSCKNGILCENIPKKIILTKKMLYKLFSNTNNVLLKAIKKANIQIIILKKDLDILSKEAKYGMYEKQTLSNTIETGIINTLNMKYMMEHGRFYEKGYLFSS